MSANGEFFSTHQIARLCHCSPRTVGKWIDGKILSGYRLPGTHQRRHRRVRADDLIVFLRQNGMVREAAVVESGEANRRGR